MQLHTNNILTFSPLPRAQKPHGSRSSASAAKLNYHVLAVLLALVALALDLWQELPACGWAAVCRLIRRLTEILLSRSVEFVGSIHDLSGDWNTAVAHLCRSELISMLKNCAVARSAYLRLSAAGTRKQGVLCCLRWSLCVSVFSWSVNLWRVGYCWL